MGIRFEWRKWLKLPKNQLVLLILLALFVSVLVMIEIKSQQQAEDYLIHLREDSGRFVMDQADSLMGFIAAAPDLPLTEREELSDLYLLAYSQLDKYYLAVENQEEQASQGEYLAFLATLKQLEARNMLIPTLIEESLPLSAAKMTYLKQHKLVSEESLPQPTGVRTLVDFLLAITSLSGMCCLLLLFYDFFTFDYEHQQIRLVYTQPLKRSRLIRHKLAVVALALVSLIGLFSLIALLYGWLRSGQLGSVKSPVAISQAGDQIVIVTVGQLLVYTLAISTTIVSLPMIINQLALTSQWVSIIPTGALTFGRDYLTMIASGKLNSQLLISLLWFSISAAIFTLLGTSYLRRLDYQEISS